MTRVEKLFSSRLSTLLFNEAREIFPDYNGKQAQDAAEWIFERLYADSMSDDEKNELYEHIYAGLT